MADFKFPRSPEVERESRFEDSQGKNPFGEQTGGGAVDENFYGSSAAHPSSRDQAVQYVTTLPSRPKRVLGLGLVGLLLAAAGICVAAAEVVRSGNLGWGLTMGMSFQFIGLALSLPAWILGASALKAIRAGAMETDRVGQIRTGLGLGIAGVLIGVCPILLWLGVSLLHL